MRSKLYYILFLALAGIMMAAALVTVRESAYFQPFKTASGTGDGGTENSFIQVVSRESFEERRQSLPEADFSPSDYLWRGGPAACDSEKASVYLPCNVSALTDLFAGLMPSAPRSIIYVCRDEKMEDPAAAVAEGHAFEALLVSGQHVQAFHIILTGLPALCIEKTDREEILNKEEHEGRLRYIPLDQTDAGTDFSEAADLSDASDFSEAADLSDVSDLSEAADLSEASDLSEAAPDALLKCTFHVRGNVSSGMDKKPYKISLTNGAGEKMKVSLGGLRADDDWILNPLYTDQSRVREMTAYTLWDRVSAFSDSPQASSRMRYVEVFLDHSYQGIYGLMEPVDGTQLGLSPGDLLYKIDRWDREYPYIDLYEESEGKTEIYNDYGFPCVEIRYPIAWDPSADWSPMQAFHEFSFRTKDPRSLTAAGLETDIDSVVTLSLYCAMTHAMDNNWKNSFLIAKQTDGGYQLFRTIWDLNYVFGDVFIFEPDEKYTVFDPKTASGYTPCEDSTYDFEAFLQADLSLEGSLADKWAVWRKGGISADSICQDARVHMSRLTESGALAREMERWPQQKNCAEALDEMEEWIRARFAYLDERYGWNAR